MSLQEDLVGLLRDKETGQNKITSVNNKDFTRVNERISKQINVTGDQIFLYGVLVIITDRKVVTQ